MKFQNRTRQQIIICYNTSAEGDQSSPEAGFLCGVRLTLVPLVADLTIGELGIGCGFRSPVRELAELYATVAQLHRAIVFYTIG
jgi:hypothetical protein